MEITSKSSLVDSGSNSSLMSMNVTRKLGGPKVHLTMSLAGGQKKYEESELINITVVSTSEEDIQAFGLSIISTANYLHKQHMV